MSHLKKLIENYKPLKSRLPGYLCVPHISLDIETTGTTPGVNKILQIAALFHNGKVGQKREDMPYINLKFWYDPNENIQCSIGALGLQKNQEMLAEQSKIAKFDLYKMCYDIVEWKDNPKKPGKKLPVQVPKKLANYNEGWVTPEVGRSILLEYLQACHEETQVYYKALSKIDPKEKDYQALTFCGKNFQGFDLLFLRAEAEPDSQLADVLKRGIKQRVLDVGSVYAPFFGFCPSLDHVNAALNKIEVSHDALDDAYDCMEANLAMLELFDTLIESYKKNNPSENEISTGDAITDSSVEKKSEKLSDSTFDDPQ